MPALIDLLDQYLFSDAPGLQARAALRRAWELATASTWDELYIASLEDALTEELPHLSAYSGRSTRQPNHPELALVLATDMGDAGANIQTLDQSSRAFLTELARAMQSQRLITINNHNLFTDEYRQILLNLFDHAHIRFKSFLKNSEAEFSAALATGTGYDSILAASISNYLERQFGVLLTTLALNLPTPHLPERESAPEQHVTENFWVEPHSLAVETEGELGESAQILPPVEQARSHQDDESLPSPVTPEPVVSRIIPDLPKPPSIPPELVIPSNIRVAPDTEVAVRALQEDSKGVAPSPPAGKPLGPLSEPEPHVADTPPRAGPNRLRVLLATPADVQTERRLLTELVRELDMRSRTRFGLELALVNPASPELTGGQSLVELADIFIGVVWLQFGAHAVETDDNGVTWFAGMQKDFALALEQGSARDEGWLRTVIYRSIRPPLDLLHLDVMEYGRVQQFFERAGAYVGDDLVRVYLDPSELVNDARARLDAWVYNYAGDLAFALSEYGKNAAISGQPTEALADFDQAIALYRELDRPEQELALWLSVGELHQQTRNATAATDAFDTALRLARRVEDDNAAAVSLHALGVLDANAGEWQEALQKYQEARAYLNPSDETYREVLADEMSAHENLGDVARMHGGLVPADESYRSALRLGQEIADTPRLATLWNKLGALAGQRGEWTNAVSAYDKALAHLSAQDTEARRAIFDAQANAHAQLANDARSRGDTELAERAYQAALRANAQGTSTRAQRSAWFRALGELAAGQADWERSIEANEQALALLDSPADVDARRAVLAQQADAYQQLGAARLEQDDRDNATNAYRDALAIYEELDLRPQQGAVLYYLGAISFAQEHQQEANTLFTQALAHLDATDATGLRVQALRRQADALRHIGDAHREAKEYGQAEIAYLQARGNFEQLGLAEETGALLYRLGIVTAAQSRLPEALAYFQQARARTLAGTQNDVRVQILRAEIETLRRFAEMYRGAGDSRSAQGYARQQLDLAQELRDDALEADAFDLLGLIAAEQSEWDRAVDLYDQALASLEERTQPDLRTVIQHHQLIAYEKLGERNRAAQQLAQAELAYRSALTLAQALSEREREANLLYMLGLISIEHENWEEALTSLRRSLGIYNLMPSAPKKPKIIWNIGRAQRGQKQAQLHDAFANALARRDPEALAAALQLAREFGDIRTAAMISEEMGTLAAENSDWTSALSHYGDALAGLTEPDDTERRSRIQRALLNTRRERSDVARAEGRWTAADADLFVALDLARELDDLAAQADLVYRRGQVAAGQSHWNEAIDLYSDALNRSGDSTGMRAMIERAQAEACEALGNTERDAQNWEGAEAAFAQALVLRRGLSEPASQARLLATLGEVATRQARWSDAVARLSEARNLTLTLQEPSDGSSAVGVAIQLETLDAKMQSATQALKRERQAEAERRGDAKRATREFESARSEYMDALRVAEELQDRASEAELNAKLGFVATERGAFEDAIEYYRLAAGLYDAPGDAAQQSALIELQAQTRQELGNRAGAVGNWDEALQNYSQAIALLDAPGQSTQRNTLVRLQAVTLLNLGDRARDGQRWNDALDAYRRATGFFALVGAGSDERVAWARESDILAQLARDAHSNKDYDVAQNLYTEAVARSSDARALDALAQLRAEQLKLYRDAADGSLEGNDITSARRLYRQALSIAQEVEDRDGEADLYHRLGQLAARQNDWQAALLSYQYALDRAEEASELRRAILRDQQTAYQELGTSQRTAGDFAAAEASYSRAYANAQTLEDSRSVGELAFLLGMLAADENAWESALGYYQRALSTLEPTRHADVKSYQAFVYQQLGDARRADGQIEAAASAYGSGLSLADALGDSSRGGQILYRLGLLETMQSRWENALATYRLAEERLSERDAQTIQMMQQDVAFARQAIQRHEFSTQVEQAVEARQTLHWEEAATSYRSALALAQELGDDESIDAVRHALVELYAEKGDTLRGEAKWDEGREAYRESLRLARDYGFSDDVAQREHDLIALAEMRVHTLRASSDWVNAARAAQDQLALAQEFGNADAQADALYNLGVLAAEQENWSDARAYYEQARPLLVKAERASALISLDADLATANDILSRRAKQIEYLKLAEGAADRSDYEQASSAYRSALDIARSLGDTAAVALIAQALVAVAKNNTNALRNAADWQGAERAAQEQFAVAKEFDDPRAQADATKNLGDFAVARQQLASAKNYYEQARALLLEQGRRDELAAVEVELARVNDVLERQAQQAHAIADAQTAHTAQRFDEAITAYRTALALAQGLGDEAAEQMIATALVQVAADKANLLQSRQEWSAAQRAYREAMAVANEFGDTAAVQANQRALLTLAQQETAVRRTAPDRAGLERAAQAQLALAQEFADVPAQADALATLGRSAAASAAWLPAQAHYEQAHALLLQSNDPAALAAVEVELARVNDVLERQAQQAHAIADAQTAHTAQRFDEAITAYRTALALAQGLGDEAAEQMIATALVQVAADKANLLQSRQEWSAAQRAYREAMAVANEFGDAGAAHARGQELIQLAAERARALRRQQEWTSAESAYREALAVAQEFHAADAVRACERELIQLAAERAAVMAQGENWEQTKAAYREALTVAREFGDAEAVRTREHELIQLAAERAAAIAKAENWEQTEAAYREARAVAQEFEHAAAAGARTQELIQLAMQRAHALRQQEAWTAAAAYRHALALANEFDDLSARLACQADLLSVAAARTETLHAQGDLTQAERAAQQHFALAQEFGNAGAQGDALVVLGTLAETQREYETAHTYFLHAAEAYEQGEMSQGIATAQHAVQRMEDVLERYAQLQSALVRATSAQAAGQFEQAAVEYQAVLANPLADRATQAHAHAALGSIAAAQSKWISAQKEFTLAQELYKELDQQSDIATLEVQQARVSRQLQIVNRDAARARGALAFKNAQWSEATRAFQQGLLLAQALQDTQSVGEFQYELARVAGAQRRWQAAADLYEAAAGHFDSAGNPEQRMISLDQKINVLTSMIDEQAAREEWYSARAGYMRVWLLADRLERHEQAVHVLRLLGYVASQQNDLHAALNYYDRAFATRHAQKMIEERDAIIGEQAQVWEQIGNLEMDARKFADAEFAYEQALAKTRALNDDAASAQILQSLGLVRSAQEKWQSARDAHQEAYHIIQSTDVPEARLAIVGSLARVEHHLGELETARQHYMQALELAHALSDTESIAEIEIGLAEIATAQTHWQDALAHYEVARHAYQALGSETPLSAVDSNQAIVYAELGNVLYGEGQWQEAETAFTRALALDIALGRAGREAELSYLLGRSKAAQGKHVEAIVDYDRASAALTRGEETLWMAGDLQGSIDDRISDVTLRDRILAQLAFSLQQEGKRAQEAGEWTQAESTVARARIMAEASNNSDQAADLSFRLGKIYAAQARQEDAVRAYRHAYELDRLDGNALQHLEISQAIALASLEHGRDALANDRSEEAEMHLGEALTFAQESQDPQLLGEVLQTLGDAANGRGETHDAIEFYARAGHTFAAIEDSERWRMVSQRQADLLRTSASQELDTNAFADAENLYRRARLLQQAAGDTSYDAETHFGLARALLAQERYDEALAEFEQADRLLDAGAPERSALMKLHADALEATGAQAMAQTRWEDAQQAFLRAAAYRDELGERGQAGLDWQKLAEIATQQAALKDAVRANEKALERLDTPDTSTARHSVLRQQAQVLAGIGDTQRQTGDWANASDTYRRALAIAQEQGDLPTMAQLYLLLGSLAAAQENWDDASMEYHHALDVYQELNQSGAQAGTWMQLGDMHRRAANYDGALADFEHALDLYRKGGDRLHEGTALERIGHVQGDRAEWDRALDEYQAALHIYNEIDARSAKPDVYRALERAVRGAKLKAADKASADGDANADRGEWTAAEEAYREALDLYAETGERAQHAQMQNQLGAALEAQMRFDEALAQYREALAGFEELGIVEAQVGVLSNIGDIQRNWKLWNDSEAAYRQALALTQQSNDRARAGELFNSLGKVREEQGDWDGAIQHYQEALAHFESAGVANAPSETLAGLARVQRGAKQEQEAEYKQALELARASGNLADAGEILNTLGLMAAEDKKWDEALNYYREAVATFERLEAEADMDAVWRTAQGTVLNNIGDVSQEIGAWRDADYAYTRALGLAREIGDRESEALLLSNLGITAQEQAQLPRALDLNMRALESYRALGDDTPRAELLERVGDLQLKLEQRIAAEATYRNGLDMARAANDVERVPRLLQQLGLLAEARGADKEALSYYDEALSRSIELEQVNQQKALLARQGALYTRASQWERAERAQRAALALATQQGDEPLEAELHTQLAIAAEARQDWLAALVEHQAALGLYEKFLAPREQILQYERIGYAHARLGDWDEADRAYAAALDLAQGVPDMNRSELWMKRAHIAENENRWRDAVRYYENARVAVAADALAETRLGLLFQRGDAALQARDWSIADTSYNDALELANTADNRAQYGWGMNRLGVLAQAQRQWDDALENFQEAIEILRVNEQPLGEAHVLNNIARLKLETGNGGEADLFAQAALAIAQALGSGQEASRSLYIRGLVALDAQEFEPARRFMKQAIAANPSHASAQLQLGNALLAEGNIGEAVQQAEAGLGQSHDWELGAQAQITIASLTFEDTRAFKNNLKRLRTLMSEGTEGRHVSKEFMDAVELVVRALEGNGESILEELSAWGDQPALLPVLDAQRFARMALLALSKSPRRFRGKPALVTYFSTPKPRTRKGRRPRGETRVTPVPPSPTDTDTQDRIGDSETKTTQDDDSPVE